MYRGTSDFKRGYKPRTTSNIVKDEEGEFVTAYHNILATWVNHFFQLFSVPGVSE
jgi:hypothetical protein